MAVGVMIVLVIFWILLGIGGLVGLFFAIRALPRTTARASRKKTPRKGERDGIKFDDLKKNRPPLLLRFLGAGGAAASGKFPAGKASGGQTGPPVFQNTGGSLVFGWNGDTRTEKRHPSRRSPPISGS